MRLALSFLCLLLFSNAALAAPLVFEVVDQDENPVEHAALSVFPADGQTLPDRRAEPLEMKQEDVLFKPFVLTAGVGQEIFFPNQDRVRHHVYSFSRGNQFELRLYGKDEEKSVRLQTPGVVAIGCNIHDNMLAFILVTDAALSGTSDKAGRAALGDVPPGAYEIKVWHPDLAEETMTTMNISVAEGENTPVRIRLDLKPGRTEQQEADFTY